MAARLRVRREVRKLIKTEDDLPGKRNAKDIAVSTLSTQNETKGDTDLIDMPFLAPAEGNGVA